MAQKKPLQKAINASDTNQNIIRTDSPVKSLSKTEYNAYQNGDPMGLTRLAELNNYPAPSRVLALEKQLKLSAAQRTKLIAANEALLLKSREIGRVIIQNEKKLNDLFVSGKIDEGSLIYFTNQFG